MLEHLLRDVQRFQLGGVLPKQVPLFYCLSFWPAVAQLWWWRWENTLHIEFNIDYYKNHDTKRFAVKSAALSYLCRRTFLRLAYPTIMGYFMMDPTRILVSLSIYSWSFLSVLSKNSLILVFKLALRRILRLTASSLAVKSRCSLPTASWQLCSLISSPSCNLSCRRWNYSWNDDSEYGWALWEYDEIRVRKSRVVVLLEGARHPWAVDGFERFVASGKAD